MAVLQKALGHEPADLKFFNMRTETIAGKEVMALRHGMAGQPGWELFGPSRTMTPCTRRSSPPARSSR